MIATHAPAINTPTGAARKLRCLCAALTLTLGAVPAAAQTPAPAPAPAATPVRPKPVTTITVRPAPPVRPALQTPADTAGAMTALERRAIQSDLAWIGKYNGVINGEVSERMVAAIKAFQKDRNAKQTGVLNPQERGLLAETARKSQDKVGWKLSNDAATGVRLGLPTKLAGQHTTDAQGSRWSNPGNTIAISVTRRKEAEPTAAKLAEQERRSPARKITYSLVRPDFFVLSGTEGAKKFYLRGGFRDGEVRILTILYDTAQETVMDPVVIAMSSAFSPFAGTAAVAGPAPRKPVEYGSGVVVSADGVIVTDRKLIEGCRSIVIPGFGNADRIGEDKTTGLALLRIYGARGLAPVAIPSAPDPATALQLRGIADPQNQGGGGAISSVSAVATPGADGELSLSAAPEIGFAGAAAFTGNGSFAGLVLQKPTVVAGPAGAPQAVLAPAAAIAVLLKASAVLPQPPAAATNVAPATSSTILRVICVRR